MRWLWLLLLLCLLAACDRVVAGGSAVEGETVTARLVDSRGKPLAFASVQASSPDSVGWLLDLLTDSLGRVNIQVPPGIRDLVISVDNIDHPGQKMVFHLTLRPSLDTTLVLERWGSLSGRILPPTGWTAKSVSLPGVGLHAPVVQFGFSFPHIRPGSWAIALEADSAGVAKQFDLGLVLMPVGEGAVYREFEVRTNVALRIGFDDPALASVGCLSKSLSTNSAVGTGANCFEAAVGKDAWSGSSLRLDLPGTTDNQAIAKIQLAPSDSELVMIRSDDTLVFQARGTGDFHVVLTGAIGDTSFSRTGAVVPLQPTWTRVAIPVGDLLNPAKNQAGVNRMQLVATEQVWMVLDQFELATKQP